jgi:hypothetical protein
VARFRYFVRASIVLILGTSLGLLIGWLVFSISTLSGKPLFIVEGGLIGLIISAIMLACNRGSGFLTLSEVTLSLPEFAQMKFVTNLEYRRVAWKLFVETLTRVATQPLGLEDGSLREALTSLYGLFGAAQCISARGGGRPKMPFRLESSLCSERKSGTNIDRNRLMIDA